MSLIRLIVLSSLIGGWSAFFGWLGRASETGALLKLEHIAGDGPFQQLLTDYFNQSRNLLITEERINRALLERAGSGTAASETYTQVSARAGMVSPTSSKTLRIARIHSSSG